MASQLAVGKKVSFLTEVGHGIILEIQEHRVKVQDESGFEYWYPKEELVPYLTLSEKELFQTNHAKSEDVTRVKSKTKPQKEEEWIIDLHMENLVDSHELLSNHEIVLTQLKHFNKFMAKAEKAKIGKILVIHGQGTGKLKSEIKLIVRGIKGAEMYDADYQKNGTGASFIERKYNIR